MFEQASLPKLREELATEKVEEKGGDSSAG
jgi:hypothetical protein